MLIIGGKDQIPFAECVELLELCKKYEIHLVGHKATEINRLPRE